MIKSNLLPVHIPACFGNVGGAWRQPTVTHGEHENMKNSRVAVSKLGSTREAGRRLLDPLAPMGHSLPLMFTKRSLSRHINLLRFREFKGLQVA